MATKTHSIAIGLERLGENVFLAVSATGTLTHQDYELMTPLIDGALSQIHHPKVKVLVDASQLDGWELRAAWDDFKLGLKYNHEFEKVAMYGKPGWQKLATRVANWFASGEIKFFEQREQALQWLLENN